MSLLLFYYVSFLHQLVVPVGPIREIHSIISDSTPTTPLFMVSQRCCWVISLPHGYWLVVFYYKESVKELMRYYHKFKQDFDLAEAPLIKFSNCDK